MKPLERILVEGERLMIIGGWQWLNVMYELSMLSVVVNYDWQWFIVENR